MRHVACGVRHDFLPRMPHLLVVLLACLCRAGTAWAHGFGQRYDLPVPLWLYVTGAGAAVVLSFVVLGVFVRGPYGRPTYPRLNLLRLPSGRLLAHPVCLFCLRLLSVCLFVLLLLTGLLGHPHPMRNLAPTLVWIVWWVGLAYVATLGGNLWAVLNPWQVLFTWAEALARRLTSVTELTLRLPYPRACGQWPGVLLFLAFAWIELVFAGAAVPANLARLALVYSGLTWTGMVLFGPEVWLRYGGSLFAALWSVGALCADRSPRGGAGNLPRLQPRLSGAGRRVY